MLGKTGTFKQAVIMGYSNAQYYQAQEKLGTGSSWGGGSRDGLGFGATTGCDLYAWPANLKDLVPALTSTRAPEAGLCRDWNYSTYGGTYATTLGGWFHEMGHSFGLEHTPIGIMSPQIDQTGRFFLVEDVVRNKQYITPDNELPNTWWDPSQITMWDGTFFTITPVSLAAYKNPGNGSTPIMIGNPGGNSSWSWQVRGYSLDGRKW